MKTFFQNRTALGIACLVALLACGMQRTWGWQLGQWGAGLTPWCGDLRVDMLLFVGIGALLTSGWVRRHVRLEVVLLGMLLGVQAWAVKEAWPVAVGKMAQGIDHPAFLFRLHEFFEVFPTALGSYNPWWNAGTEHFIGVTSGVHAFGLVMAPFLLFAPLEYAYSVALLFWMAIGFPWLTVVLFRRAGLRWSACFAAGLMLMAFTRAEFLFFWQSGNLGGMVSALLAPGVVALAYRIAVQRRGTWPDAVGLGILAWLMCLWTPGVFTVAGLMGGWVWNWHRWTRRSVSQIVTAGVLALALLSPWLWTTFVPARGIVSYVVTSAPESLGSMVRAGLVQCGHRLLEWHPLLLVGGGVMVLGAGSRPLRRWMLPLVFFLAAVTCSVGFKRNSQLDRVAIQWAAAMAFPAAIWISHAFRAGPRRVEISRVASVLVLGLLLMGGRIALAHYSNSAGFKLWPAYECVWDFAQWIRENVPEEGRFAFAGITDCKYEWGKPTYLPILSGREMMSDDYYGYPKGLTERNYPPKIYRQSLGSFLFFSEVYGITHWAVTDSRHKRFFDEYPNSFECIDYRMLQSTHIYVYRVRKFQKVSRILLGEGTVEARENHLTVSISEQDQNVKGVVLRYNWRDGLRSLTPGATIAPFPMDNNLTLIAVYPNGKDTVEIGYRPQNHPLQPNFDGSFHH